ncbi:Pentatricopeptide repeat-containing protein 2, mitochondrial [Golovinomyces cichoracearum]|uniref:Pentatricopeptide repeat-containing protein 2, mitochondrial n=1 Tax=Golovinomyces cichoracearum TaxID=62708 RepID=A0A420HUX8_9PEZI|nr:Pentatricopeptide repeat-containing protein 2, mitochondrial [Golovinomyces cichoracearum]
MGAMQHMKQKILVGTNHLSLRFNSIYSIPTRVLREAQFIQRRNVYKLESSRSSSSSHSTQKLLTTDRINKRRQWISHRKSVATGIRRCIDTRSNFHISLRNDPLKLADYIRRILNKGNFEVALKTVRDASRTTQCVVSWNHLIDWLMSKGKMRAAFKIYQEMKKRANIPDAHTYTILFRGCSQSKHSKQALARVMAVYQSMLLERSQVKPNIIHMNAILKMYATAGEIDSMLYLMSELPTSGVRAANSITFSTVLNALRHNALYRLPTGLSPDHQRQRIREMVVNGRKIWRDILSRWQRGDMWIDEDLVSSIGRILLISEDRTDWDEILTLIEQTMSIPRQLPSLRPSRDLNNDAEGQLKSRSTPSDQSQLDNSNLTLESVPVTPTVSSLAKPGRNSLSLVLNALLLLSAKEAATKYWNIFTKEHHVQPDLENYVSYLRILRIFRASTESVELLRTMPQKYMCPKIFRIAISSCVRDKNNQHAFSNAGKILDLMHRSLKEPDVPTIIRYLELSQISSTSSREESSDLAETISKERLGAQILRALDRVQELLLSIKSYLFFGDTDLERQSNRHEFLSNVELLVQKAILAHTRILNNKMVPNQLFLELKDRRFQLLHLKSRLTKQKNSVVTSPKTQEHKAEQIAHVI